MHVQCIRICVSSFVCCDGQTSLSKLQAENKESGKLAALKRVPIRDETELDDFMVEIEILAECKHRNIVGMYEAFSFDSALWVC